MHWTQDQAIAFEAAKECIGHWMAIHTGMIADESGKAAPDAEIITRLRARRSALAQERAGLHIGQPSRHCADSRRLRGQHTRMAR
jgi:hypothetical protein